MKFGPKAGFVSYYMKLPKEFDARDKDNIKAKRTLKCSRQYMTKICLDHSHKYT